MCFTRSSFLISTPIDDPPLLLIATNPTKSIMNKPESTLSYVSPFLYHLHLHPQSNHSGTTCRHIPRQPIFVFHPSLTSISMGESRMLLASASIALGNVAEKRTVYRSLFSRPPPPNSNQGPYMFHHPSIPSTYSHIPISLGLAQNTPITHQHSCFNTLTSISMGESSMLLASASIALGNVAEKRTV